MSKELQRKWFNHFFPDGATVAVDSGNKSIHHFVRFTDLTEENLSYLCSLFKKCFPFSDWGVFQDSAKLVRNPGGKRDSTIFQNIIHLHRRYSFQEVCSLLEPYAKNIKDANITEARTTLKEYLFDGKLPVSWKGKKPEEMIVLGLEQLAAAGYVVENGLIYEAYLENFRKRSIPEKKLQEFIAKAKKYKQAKKVFRGSSRPLHRTRSGYNYQWLGERLAQVDLVKVLERFYGHITVTKEIGNKKIILCPYHDDHHPSAWITKEPNGVELIHCSADCPVHGHAKDAIHVMMDHGFSFSEACEELFGEMPRD
jgi:hypothetical protein